jgi:hypothetical protein
MTESITLHLFYALFYVFTSLFYFVLFLFYFIVVYLSSPSLTFHSSF